MKPRPAIDLQIDELLLHGYPAGDRQRIGAAFEQELARLLSTRLPPSLSRGGEVAGIDGGSFRAVAGARPEAVGAQVALQVYRGMSR